MVNWKALTIQVWLCTNQPKVDSTNDKMCLKPFYFTVHVNHASLLWCEWARNFLKSKNICAPSVLYGRVLIVVFLMLTSASYNKNPPIRSFLHDFSFEALCLVFRQTNAMMIYLIPYIFISLINVFQKSGLDFAKIVLQLSK